ncbi:MAG: hypothetical protein HY351_01660, partial [Candidatus Omnitrophica bacterium]|nr:hypothetical protein [Candidatus Omnitrophota bacterium]
GMIESINTTDHRIDRMVQLVRAEARNENYKPVKSLNLALGELLQHVESGSHAIPDIGSKGEVWEEALVYLESAIELFEDKEHPGRRGELFEAWKKKEKRPVFATLNVAALYVDFIMSVFARYPEAWKEMIPEAQSRELRKEWVRISRLADSFQEATVYMAQLRQFLKGEKGILPDSFRGKISLRDEIIEQLESLEERFADHFTDWLKENKVLVTPDQFKSVSTLQADPLIMKMLLGPKPVAHRFDLEDFKFKQEAYSQRQEATKLLQSGNPDSISQAGQMFSRLLSGYREHYKDPEWAAWFETAAQGALLGSYVAFFLLLDVNGNGRSNVTQSIQLKMDKKNRVQIPAEWTEWRNGFKKEGVMVMAAFNGSKKIYISTPSLWKLIMEQMVSEGNPSMDEVLDREVLVYSHSFRLRLVQGGGVVIPERVLRNAQIPSRISQEVTLQDFGDYMELTSRAEARIQIPKVSVLLGGVQTMSVIPSEDGTFLIRYRPDNKHLELFDVDLETGTITHRIQQERPNESGKRFVQSRKQIKRLGEEYEALAEKLLQVLLSASQHVQVSDDPQASQKLQEAHEALRTFFGFSNSPVRSEVRPVGGRDNILPDVVQPVPKIEAKQRTPTQEDAAGREKQKRDVSQQTSQGPRPVGYGQTLTKKGQIQATQKALDVFLSNQAKPPASLRQNARTIAGQFVVPNPDSDEIRDILRSELRRGTQLDDLMNALEGAIYDLMSKEKAKQPQAISSLLAIGNPTASDVRQTLQHFGGMMALVNSGPILDILTAAGRSSVPVEMGYSEEDAQQSTSDVARYFAYPQNGVIDVKLTPEDFSDAPNTQEIFKEFLRTATDLAANKNIAVRAELKGISKLTSALPRTSSDNFKLLVFGDTLLIVHNQVKEYTHLFNAPASVVVASQEERGGIRQVVMDKYVLEGTPVVFNAK